MKDSKNQIIRSMKSYETGGSTDDSCFDGGGKKCKKPRIVRVRSPKEKAGLAAKIVGGAGAAIIGAAANKKYGLIDKLKEKLNLQNGGLVKKQMGGSIAGSKLLKNNPKIASKIANAKTVIRNVKKITSPRAPKKYQMGGQLDANDPTKKRGCQQGGCGGAGSKIKSAVSGLFSNDRNMTTHRSNRGKKNNPSLKKHRIKMS